MSLPQRVFRASPARMAGVTLVELMIALVLGLVVTGAALALFATNKQTYIASESLGRIQESGRVAFELLSRDLRDAAGNPCDNTSSNYQLTNGLKTPANWWYTDWSSGVRGYAATTPFADAAFGTGSSPPQRLSGTEAVELKGVDVTSAVVSVAEPANRAAPVVVASLGDLQANDLLVLCDFWGAAIFQATGFTGTSINHAQAAGAFGNATGDVNKVNIAAPGAPVPAAWNVNGQVARLRASRWFVGNNARGGRSLYRSSLRNTAGVLSVVSDEIVEGLATTGSPFQLRYLVVGGSSYVDASLVPAADWNRIAAVRINLTLVGRENAGTDGAPLQRSIQTVVTLRNKLP